MYLIIGANGFLGSYLIRAIKENTDSRIFAADLNLDDTVSDPFVTWVKCDVTSKEDIASINAMLPKDRDNKVIYLAAYHHPDLVEKNPKIAWNINITALSTFINALENVKCFFYPSTDSVYGETAGSYHFKETDTINPVNRYGCHKATAECLVNAYGYNVVRFPFLIGPSLLPHKKHFYDEIAKTILSGKPMEMFLDSLRSSLDFMTVARLTIDLMEKYDEAIPKVLNVSGDEDLSKYDVGLKIAEKLGVPKELIVPIPVDKTQGIFEAKRAKSTLLDNSCVKRVLGIGTIKMSI